ncbi:MAG TPA: hypothetical protein VFW96_29880 [Thermomicrobiales bacterium]|nr:hypothetical protein [Thermomicrobiales bacterium]
MEYRLIRNTVTGHRLVIGSDGYASTMLGYNEYLTSDAELRADWWAVPRREYDTALWDHPLWCIEARYRSDGAVPLARPDGPDVSYAEFLAALDRAAAIGSRLDVAHRERALLRLRQVARALGVTTPALPVPGALPAGDGAAEQLVAAPVVAWEAAPRLDATGQG